MSTGEVVKQIVLFASLSLTCSAAYGAENITKYSFDCHGTEYDTMSQTVKVDVNPHGTMGIPDSGGTVGVKLTILGKPVEVKFSFSKEKGNIVSVTATEPGNSDVEVMPDLSKPIASMTVPLRLDGKDSFEMNIFPPDIVPYAEKVACTLGPL